MGDISVGRGFAPHVALILRLSLFTRREPMVLISDLMELNSQCQNTDAHASTASTQLARVKSAVSSAPFILLTALLIAVNRSADIVPSRYNRRLTCRVPALDATDGANFWLQRLRVNSGVKSTFSGPQRTAEP